MSVDPFCASAFLTFRYVTRPDAEWVPGVKPRWPSVATAQRPVRSAADTLAALRELVVADARTGILLSSGIDSAILARLMPPGRRAYTIRFVAAGAVDEATRAAPHAGAAGLSLSVVDVGWQHYLDHADALMRHKGSPLHAIEVPLYVAACQARRDGIERLIVGNGADTTFGGLDKLLSRDWSYADFIRRYTFVDPALALRQPVPTDEVWSRYRRGDGIDVQAFLKEVHGIGIIQSFDNALGAAGVRAAAPYEALRFDGALDVARIRAGESKYLLRELFASLYPGLSIPDKIAFARPMDDWLAAAGQPARPELRDDIPLGALSGDQRWLIYVLDRFLGLVDP